MTSQRDTLGWLKQGARAFAFGNPLYGLTLGGRGVTGLAAVPNDPWPGDSDMGAAIMDGVFPFAGEVMQADEPVWVPHFGYGRTWIAAMNSFDWLRDLRAVGGDVARRQARTLITSWLDQNHGWNSASWAADVLGTRSPTGSRSTISTARAPTTPPLPRVRKSGPPDHAPSRVVPGSLQGAALLSAVRGFAFGGLCLPGCEKSLIQALRLLDGNCRPRCCPTAAISSVTRNGTCWCCGPDRHQDGPARGAARGSGSASARHRPHDPGAPLLPPRRWRASLFNGGREADPAMTDTVLAR